MKIELAGAILLSTPAEVWKHTTGLSTYVHGLLG
jgi:hypothetical protein